MLERVMEITEEAKPMELNRNLILAFSDNKTIFGNNTKEGVVETSKKLK